MSDVLQPCVADAKFQRTNRPTAGDTSGERNVLEFLQISKQCENILWDTDFSGGCAYLKKACCYLRCPSVSSGACTKQMIFLIFTNTSIPPLLISIQPAGGDMDNTMSIFPESFDQEPSDSGLLCQNIRALHFQFLKRILPCNHFLECILIKGNFLMKVSLELRYGREDEEMMGLQFCNEMGLLNLCVHPDKVQPLLVN